MRPSKNHLGRLRSVGIKIATVIVEPASHFEILCSNVGFLGYAARQSAGMRYTVGLAESGREQGDSNAPSFEKGNVESASLGQVFLGHLENFFLLRTENEVREVTSIPVANHETSEELFDMIER
jgi:hypothetical protein